MRLEPLHALSNMIFITSLCGISYYYLHLIDEETKAEGDLVIHSKSDSELVEVLGLECRLAQFPNSACRGRLGRSRC